MCKKAAAPADPGAARRASLRSHSDAEDTTTSEEHEEEEESKPKKPKGRVSPKRGRGKAE